MDEEASVVFYNRANNRLRLVLPGGEELQLRGLAPDLEFRAVEVGGPPRQPLWLSHEQAGILSKTIHHVLEHVRISSRAREVLAELAPQVDELRDVLEALESDDPRREDR